MYNSMLYRSMFSDWFFRIVCAYEYYGNPLPIKSGLRIWADQLGKPYDYVWELDGLPKEFRKYCSIRMWG